MLFAFPMAIAGPIITAILLGGPIVGFPVAVLVATSSSRLRTAPRAAERRRQRRVPPRGRGASDAR
jgi:hypothetical protein